MFIWDIIDGRIQGWRFSCMRSFISKVDDYLNRVAHPKASLMHLCFNFSSVLLSITFLHNIRKNYKLVEL